MKILIISVISIFSVIGIIYWYGYFQATRLPENRPQKYTPAVSKDKKVVACIGDSLTHGRVSGDYAAMLGPRLAPKGYQVLNAGINSELAYNVLQRIDEIIRCRPTHVTILIGSNDAHATMSEDLMKQSIKEMNLPQRATREWYAENIGKICDILKEKTKAKITLLSLPPIGEDRSHPGYGIMKEYSAIIKKTAREKGLQYVPLHERFDEIIPRTPSPRYPAFPKKYIHTDYVTYKAIFLRYICRKSWDEISRIHGFTLYTDFLHLNERAATVIADMIEAAVLGQEKQKGAAQ